MFGNFFRTLKEIFITGPSVRDQFEELVLKDTVAKIEEAKPTTIVLDAPGTIGSAKITPKITELPTVESTVAPIEIAAPVEAVVEVAPVEVVTTPVNPQITDAVTQIEIEKPKRARTPKGRLVADDKSTPDVNEAWVGGKAPAKKPVVAKPKTSRKIKKNK